MSQIAYINGQYLPHSQARVHIEDRGYQFADGVYEYIAFYNRTPLDLELHMKRLIRSVGEIHIHYPHLESVLPIQIRETIARNNREEGGIYIQISRGVARRDHPFPKTPARPSTVITIASAKYPSRDAIEKGISVITLPDQRWKRCDIKSISLLPNILAKQQAAMANAKEAWLYTEEDAITEGAASNAYIVTRQGEVITHPLSNGILGGVTRHMVLELAQKYQIRILEKAFTRDDIKQAAEAFQTSTSANVLPVTSVDGIAIGGGKPGPVTLKLLDIYQQHIAAQTGKTW